MHGKGKSAIRKLTSENSKLQNTIEQGVQEIKKLTEGNEKLKTANTSLSNDNNMLKEANKALQEEVTALCEEITRISDKTTFAGQQVLNGRHAVDGEGLLRQGA